MVPLGTTLKITVSTYLDIPQRQRSRYSGITIWGHYLRTSKAFCIFPSTRRNLGRLYILKCIQEIETNSVKLCLAGPAITKISSTDGLSNRNLFLTVLEAGKSQVRGQHGQVLMRGLFQVCRWQSSCYVLTWWRAEREKAIFLRCLIIRTLIPFVRALPSRPNHLPKSASPNTITLGLRIST